MINDDGDEGKEDESVLDNDVDGRFNYNGDVKDEFSDVFVSYRWQIKTFESIHCSRKKLDHFVCGQLA